MNANNGWSGKPGVPMNPERDGWHWLCHNEIDQEEAALWDAKGNFWQLIGTDETFSPRDLIVRKWRYLGPVLTPDEATALQKRAVKFHGLTVQWAEIIVTLKAERDQLIGALQVAVERSGDLKPTPSWLDGACGILNQSFLKVERAALDQSSALQKRVAELEDALDFYACVDHYQTHNAAAPNVVQFDRGAKARAALTGGKDE